jgi:lipopolysaccharide biosynthesis glycosyltransferase
MMTSNAKAPVYFVCAGNAAFNMPMAVMLTSAVANFDPERQLQIYVLSSDSGEKEREMVRRSIESVRPGLTNVEVNWPKLGMELYEGLPDPGRFALDSYSRLFAPRLLPAECDRFIYLDSDMIVLDDLGKLHDLSTSGTTVHACLDIFSWRADRPHGIFNHVELGIPPDAPLFNSGMMVIDVKRWNERGLTEKVVGYLRDHPENTYSDQTALNAHFYQDWTAVDPGWNQFDIIYPMAWEWAGHSRETYLRARDYPSVVHYTGVEKPWQLKRWLPRFGFFFQYLEKSAYRGTLPSQSFRPEMWMGYRPYVRCYMFAVQNLRRLRQAFKDLRAPKPTLEAAP